MFTSIKIAGNTVSYNTAGRILVKDKDGNVQFVTDYSPGKLKKVIRFLQPSAIAKSRNLGYFNKASELIFYSPAMLHMEVIPDDSGEFLLASPSTPEEANMKLYFRPTPGQEGAVDALFKKSAGFRRNSRYLVQHEGDFITFTKIGLVDLESLFTHSPDPIFTVY